jgi:hypothetical protein
LLAQEKDFEILVMVSLTPQPDEVEQDPEDVCSKEKDKALVLQGSCRAGVSAAKTNHVRIIAEALEGLRWSFRTSRPTAGVMLCRFRYAGPPGASVGVGWIVWTRVGAVCGPQRAAPISTRHAHAVAPRHGVACLPHPCSSSPWACGTDETDVTVFYNGSFTGIGCTQTASQ